MDDAQQSGSGEPDPAKRRWSDVFESQMDLVDWSPAPAEVDLRVKKRAAWYGTVDVRIGAYHLTCRGIDVSESGLLVEGSWSAYPGQPVSVSFEVHGRRVRGVGAVARVGSDGRWAVQFSGLGADARQQIASYVEGAGLSGNTVAIPVTAEACVPEAPVWNPVRTGETAVVTSPLFDPDTTLVREAHGTDFLTIETVVRERPGHP
jgi:hypothetical protein